MTTEEILEKLLRAYKDYYDVWRGDPAPPFAAEAVFRSNAEQYFLSKKVSIAEAESNEYVFFALEDRLTPERLLELEQRAWEEGLSRVKPHKNHQSSDVVLILLCDSAEEAAWSQIPRCSHYKSYRWSLHGWSHFRLAAVEASTGRMAFNRQGRSLRKLLQGNISKE